MLEDDGWQLVRTRGSHRQFRHPSKLGTVTVSGNTGIDVPAGTLGSILKQSRVEERLASMQYVVLFEEGQSSVGAYVPDLPGCVAVGSTREEAKQLIREAIELQIESLREHGESVPPPHSTVELIAV